MTANKDGGTTVGFSNGYAEFEKEVENLRKNTAFAKNCNHEYNNVLRCKFCGSKMTEEEKIEEQRMILGNPNWKRDFKIPENLEQINKQQWEDIWNEWNDILVKWKANGARDIQFFDWLKENYNAPEKK